MTARTAILAAALASVASLPAYAGNPAGASNPGRKINPIQELADYTGLTKRKVNMILGCRTCFAEYRYTYDRSLEQFKSALGDERYERLMAGQPVALDDQRGNRVARTGGAVDHTSTR